MTRVLIGDALVHENERLQKRINQLHDRIEAQLRQCLRLRGDRQSELSAPLANLLQCVVVGRWHQFAKSGFTRAPGGDIDLLLSRLLDVHPPETLACPHTGQAGSRGTFITRASARRPSHNSSLPISGSPTWARYFSASIACIAPITPTSGENTPASAQRNSGSSAWSGNRQ